MLLLFETGDGHYALDSRHVLEIVPLLRTKKIPAAPGYVAGIINYRGAPVPVIDLCALTTNTPCRPLYSTRIILVRYPLPPDRNRIVGLVAERVTEVIKGSAADRAAGILIDEALSARTDEQGNQEMIQWFDLNRMIPEDVVRGLFQD